DLQFPGAVADFGLSLSTTPFSFLVPISANVRFFNAQDDLVIEFASMSTTLIPGATLPNGSSIFLVGRSDVSLLMAGVTDAVRAEVRILGRNPPGWCMDSRSSPPIPPPAAASLHGVGATLAAGRRRTRPDSGSGYTSPPSSATPRMPESEPLAPSGQSPS